MRRDNHFITASEIGTWCFCSRAWYLQHLGYRSTSTKKQISGIQFHETHLQSLRAAHRQRAIARIAMLICLAILLWIGVAGLRSLR
jgi:hypothetical protein